MDKYKINYIFNEDKNINDILISILNKELKKYIEIICKNNKRELTPSCTKVYPEGGKNC